MFTLYSSENNIQNFDKVFTGLYTLATAYHTTELLENSTLALVEGTLTITELLSFPRASHSLTCLYSDLVFPFKNRLPHCFSNVLLPRRQV